MTDFEYEAAILTLNWQGLIKILLDLALASLVQKKQ